MNAEETKSYRKKVINQLELLASREEQLSYQKNVPLVNVPDELLCMWFDDLNLPKSLEVEGNGFNEKEREQLRIFCDLFIDVGGLIMRPNVISLQTLLEEPKWKILMTEAVKLLSQLI